MAIASVHGASEPMMEMNTTPLIDVMLVLLIMFIITIPVATNSIEVAMPAPASAPPHRTDPILNDLRITATDRLLWNGRPVSQPQLAALLAGTRRMSPEPELHFQPDPAASYDLSARTMRIVKASGVTRFGFVGNDRYAGFGKAADAR